ncbi:MAG: hypothetical protein RLZZ546_1232 [Bacteroidota bacterium]
MVRVRFAPSPTGPLHIGGVRTALYNYLFAKQNNGTFILRIEDTDQTRYVQNAEQYIIDSLRWAGLIPDEGVDFGGKYGPYKQSERMSIYKNYAEQLVKLGKAYYAFDSSEELDEIREKQGESFKYGHDSRNTLKNSISLSKEETEKLIAKGDNVVIRLLIPENKEIKISDTIRGEVIFNSNELDDKVMLKADGMPTYHLANIVDDHLMEITHVIRGEEWLPSTAHHILLYEALGWTPPVFAHLPLILKPTGKGKLSKRDGAKFGFPVFPLTWQGDITEPEVFPGFREEGFLPEALLNFLAFLGWNPGTDEEILDIDQLIAQFNIDKIVKNGAKFDYDKAKWYNQQYIIKKKNEEIAEMLIPQAKSMNFTTSISKLSYAVLMMKERVYFLSDILMQGHYLFQYPKEIDKDTFNKKFKVELKEHFIAIANLIATNPMSTREEYETSIKDYIASYQLKMGDVLPILRIALTGTMQGPDLFDTFAILGGEEASIRIKKMM